MAVTERNRLRLRAVLISHQVKWLFRAVPSRWQPRIRRWLWQALFLAADGKPHRAGEIVLADLREFCAPAGQPLFSTDPLIMARRAGRREVFERIVNYLNLDESEVRKLMELDDGIE